MCLCAEPQEAGPRLAGQHGRADHGAGAAGATVQHARHRPGGHGGEGHSQGSRGDTAAAQPLLHKHCLSVCLCAQRGFGQKYRGKPLARQYEHEVKTKMKCC